MRQSPFPIVLAMFMCNVLWLMPLQAQEPRGVITGNITDAKESILPGARVELQPGGQSVVSNSQGEFTILNLPTGHYTLTVSYVGFASFSKELNIAAGQIVHVDPVLQIGMQNEEVTVR